MKRFLIHVDTNWCGEEDTFRAVAESEIELWDIAEQLAYDNFYSFGHDQDIAEEEGYDPDEMTDEDWRKCDYGDNMAALGLTNYISESTRYGDWSCSTWSTPRKDVEAQLEELNALGRARWELMKQYGEDSVQAKIYDDKIADASLNIEKIGYFCADAGMVAVFLLDEVLKYNPDFDYHINREWTTTLIKDFDGEINYYVDDDAHIIGVGNVNFFTTQTGF
jgi:hypothetical protein